jgi:hypothetical protein
LKPETLRCAVWFSRCNVVPVPPGECHYSMGPTLCQLCCETSPVLSCDGEKAHSKALDGFVDHSLSHRQPKTFDRILQQLIAVNPPGKTLPVFLSIHLEEFTDGMSAVQTKAKAAAHYPTARTHCGRQE